jgi:hypothetical protein
MGERRRKEKRAEGAPVPGVGRAGQSGAEDAPLVGEARSPRPPDVEVSGQGQARERAAAAADIDLKPGRGVEQCCGSRRAWRRRRVQTASATPTSVRLRSHGRGLCKWLWLGLARSPFLE